MEKDKCITSFQTTRYTETVETFFKVFHLKLVNLLLYIPISKWLFIPLWHITKRYV